MRNNRSTPTTHLQCPYRKMYMYHRHHRISSMLRSKMFLSWSVALFVICWSEGSGATSSETRNCNIQFTATQVVLSGVPFTVQITFPPYLSYNESLPQVIYYSTEGAEFDSNGDQDLFITRKENGIASLSLTLNGKVNSLGHHILNFNFSQAEDEDLICPTQSLRLLAIPGILTIIPPVITAILAIIFRQVLLALLVGIWLCAFLGNKYNPLTAVLRTLDTYFVGSLGELDHAAIVVFTFILGGLIGVVQKSGGGIGLGRLLYCFTSTRRRASLVCILLAAFIFFDDYSCVLIAGTSLRTVVSNVGVSREKFAYILKSLGPTLPSMVPISSWIGVEVGYLRDTLRSIQCLRCCNDQGLTDDPFILVVRSIPYRFFPWLMIFSIILICLLGRDFGCMLKAERASKSGPSQTPPNETTAATIQSGPTSPSPSINRRNDDSSGDDELESSVTAESERGQGCCTCCHSNTRRRGRGRGNGREGNYGAITENTEMRRCGSEERDEDLDESVFTGSLAPKRGVPYRWFNAVVPFLLTVVVTLIGMIVGGRQKILDLPPDQNVTMSVVNIFTYADSVSSLIWASSLSSAVLLVMLLLQRILSLQEFMDSFIAGIQDVIEPTFTFVLAWALGTAMQDIHTNAYIAQALNSGGVRAEYLPPLITIIGYLMSFAAGSAFGTMGILFPLVIPTICELESAQGGQCRVDIIIQAAAAIMASSIFGNVASPIAGLTILTVFASQTTLVNHIRTSILYGIIIGAVAIVFGALPVGAGWYPWYAAWLIMIAVMCIIFILFSSSITSSTSRPLLKRICPCLYTYPARVWDKLEVKLRICWRKRPCKCQRLVSQVGGEEEQVSTEETPLILSSHHESVMRNRSPDRA